MLLPENNTYVLGFFPDMPWIEDDAENDEHKWVVVKFVRGISEEERAALPDSNHRKHSYHTGDVHANNLVPYCWKPFGPGKFFGQECTRWVPLPQF